MIKMELQIIIVSNMVFNEENNPEYDVIGNELISD